MLLGNCPKCGVVATHSVKRSSHCVLRQLHIWDNFPEAFVHITSDDAWGSLLVPWRAARERSSRSAWPRCPCAACSSLLVQRAQPSRWASRVVSGTIAVIC